MSTPFRYRDTRLLRLSALCLFVGLLALAWSVRDCYAQEAKPSHKTLAAVISSYVALNALDVVQTRSALASGRGREGNPLMQPFAGSTLTMTAVKLGASSGIAYGIWSLRKSHPKAALWIGIGAAGFQGWICYHNAMVMKR